MGMSSQERQRRYRDRNLEKRRQATRDWRAAESPEKRKERLTRYKLRPMSNNYRIASNLRKRLGCALKRNVKAGSAVSDLGCTIEQFKAYIAAKFQPGMSWDNWGHKTWHLDHIAPLASFDLSNREEFLKANHYTNIRPMWAADNLKKGPRHV